MEAATGGYELRPLRVTEVIDPRRRARARVPGRVEESATAETFLEQFVASHGARD